MLYYISPFIRLQRNCPRAEYWEFKCETTTMNIGKPSFSEGKTHHFPRILRDNELFICVMHENFRRCS